MHQNCEEMRTLREQNKEMHNEDINANPKTDKEQIQSKEIPNKEPHLNKMKQNPVKKDSNQQSHQENQKESGLVWEAEAHALSTTAA